MSPDVSLKMTGLLICYRTWDELDAVHNRLSQMQLPGSTALFKAFNPVENIPYPFTLALITKDKADLDALDDYLTDNQVDLGTDKDMYIGESRIREFLRMFLIGKYPPGFLKIRYGRCPLHGVNPGACTFCPYGHMTECHHPKTCDQAKCSHLERYE